MTYVNRGFQMPPISNPRPRPTFSSSAEAHQLSRSNRLYSKTIAGPTFCPYDPLEFRREGPDRSKQLLEAHYGCLMSIWTKSLNSAGYDLPRGPLYLVDKNFTTPCGRNGKEDVDINQIAGYYCSGNMAIYMNYLMKGFYLPNGLQSYDHEIVLAHEIGHHVQARSGILGASWHLQFQLSGEAALVENRRRELQAQCFAGMALASLAHSYGITPDELPAIFKNESSRTDSTHGNTRSVGLWFRAGFESGGQIGRCNTFAASTHDVA